MATPHLDQREDAALLQVIANQITHLHEDVGDMKTALKDLASAIIKLALVEERQGQTAKWMERLEARIIILEAAAPMNKQTSAWVLSGVWSAVAVLALYVAKSIGLY